MNEQYMLPNYYTQDPMRQRLTQLEAAQIPYQMQPYSMPTQRTPQMYPQIRCIPVASEQEAMATQTDFSGALVVMVDQAHGAIYTKQLSPQTGAAVFEGYVRNRPERAAAESPRPEETDRPVMRSEFDKLKQDFEAMLSMITEKGAKV